MLVWGAGDPSFPPSFHCACVQPLPGVTGYQRSNPFPPPPPLAPTRIPPFSVTSLSSSPSFNIQRPVFSGGVVKSRTAAFSSFVMRFSLRRFVPFFPFFTNPFISVPLSWSIYFFFYHHPSPFFFLPTFFFKISFFFFLIPTTRITGFATPLLVLGLFFRYSLLYLKRLPWVL